MTSRRRFLEWGWLQGGVALGLLSAFAFLTYKPLGVSTSYPRAVALALNQIVPDWVAANAYFQRVQPIVDWQLLLVIGIIIGGWLAARLTGRPAMAHSGVAARDVTPAAAQGAQSAVAHGASASGGTGTGARCSVRSGERHRPPIYLFLGGFLLLFGARLAGGCTSGHVITGFSQLAVASFLFAAAVFGAGIPLARYIARKEVA